MNENKNKFAGRRENRVAVMQFLYMYDFNFELDIKDTLELFFTTICDKPRDNYTFAEELIAGILAHLADIDQCISKNATNWTIDRINRVDLAILRLAIFELLFRDDIPPLVSINEAIDLSKSFSSDESKRFVNGLLDKVNKDLKNKDSKDK